MKFQGTIGPGVFTDSTGELKAVGETGVEISLLAFVRRYPEQTTALLQKLWTSTALPAYAFSRCNCTVVTGHAETCPEYDT